MSRADAIRRLTDRELMEAIFFMLSSFAEKQTGEAPIVIGKGYCGMPDFIYGAGGPVAWIESRDPALKPKPESVQEQPDTPTPTLEVVVGAL